MLSSPSESITVRAVELDAVRACRPGADGEDDVLGAP